MTKTETAKPQNAARSKSRRRPEERPDEILDAALELFLAQGFHRTTVEQIARAAQLSKGAVYLYFPAKPDLLVALVRRGVGGMADHAAALLRSHQGDPRQALRKLFVQIGQRAQQNPNFAKVPRLILHEVPTSPELAEIYRTEVLDKVLPALIDLLARGVAAGHIRRLDPEMTARCVVGPMLAHLLLSEIFGLQPAAGLQWQSLLETQLSLLDAGLAPAVDAARHTNPSNDPELSHVPDLL